MNELITIQYENNTKKEIIRPYIFGQNVPAMVILDTLNRQGHGVKSVTIMATEYPLKK